MYFCEFCSEYIVNCEIVRKCIFPKLVPRSRALVCIEITILSRSFDRPTIEESFSKMGPQSREIEIFGKGTQGKRKTSTKIRLRYCEKFRPQV